MRLVVTSDGIPEITFAAPTGEAISFEDADADVFRCEQGVNVFAFTELDSGIFIVNRKTVDIVVEVDFDPCGGTLDETAFSFRLGAPYSALPTPALEGHVFLGWFTDAEGGVEVVAADRCKSDVTRLYAHWEIYEDPFAPAICVAGDLAFFSGGESPWYIDGEGAARSGAIGDDCATTLSTTVRGRGALYFRWRTSSEENFDWLRLLVDGGEIASISGVREWEDFSHDIDGDGPHTVEWRYDKDGSVLDGEDCGWIDDVAWEPEGGS